MPTVTKPCARDRLLAAADELFYAEGVQTVGIDRIIEHAGVAKASLYNTFGSKDELVRAYLGGRHERTKARLAKAIAKHDDPREQLLAIFDAQAKLFSDPSFHGCAFANANAEAAPGTAAAEATDAYYSWLRGLFTDLAKRAGAKQPKLLARQLQLVYAGSSFAGRLDDDVACAKASRTAAAALITASIG
ncbi:MAG: TetR/AcrR family transcriptional regulator [Nocardioidaceae bacterium]|nr:TetR/AcrR family transcriptional regulator [Nocardioidaceae bacterium]